MRVYNLFQAFDKKPVIKTLSAIAQLMNGNVLKNFQIHFRPMSALSHKDD
jgi:hypothetical protein